jgi:hypothetical protein
MVSALPLSRTRRLHSPCSHFLGFEKGRKRHLCEDLLEILLQHMSFSSEYNNQATAGAEVVSRSRVFKPALFSLYSNVFHQEVGHTRRWATPPKRVQRVSSHPPWISHNALKPLKKKAGIFLLLKRFNLKKFRANVRLLSFI